MKGWFWSGMGFQRRSGPAALCIIRATQLVAGRYECFATYVALLASATRATLATGTQATMLMEMVWMIETVLVLTRVCCALLAEGLLNHLQLVRHHRLHPTLLIRGFDYGKKGFHTMARPALNVLRPVFVDECAGKQSPNIPLNETIANKDIP
jgi:hypothetical protein